jgi:hypothetical protein
MTHFAALEHPWSRACRAGMLALCCLPSALLAAELTPEQRLQAIRQALVEAAMKSNTRVSATSWMDTNGALREYNRFSSEIKVRELQVTRYGRDEAQEPQAEVMAAAAAIAMAKSMCSGTCKSRWRHLLLARHPMTRAHSHCSGRCARPGKCTRSSVPKMWCWVPQRL